MENAIALLVILVTSVNGVHVHLIHVSMAIVSIWLQSMAFQLIPHLSATVKMAGLANSAKT